MANSVEPDLKESGSELFAEAYLFECIEHNII